MALKPQPAPALELEDGNLVGSNGAVVLQELAPEAQLGPHPAGGVVVGLDCSARQPAALMDVALGKLCCSRFLALSKMKQYWMAPAWGSAARQVPIETQLLLLELAPEPVGASRGHSPLHASARFALLLPLIDGDRFRASLRHARRGDGVPPDALVVRLEIGDDTVTANSFSKAVYIQLGSDPYSLLDQGVEAAVKLSGSGRVRREKPEPPTLDLFGWCTWDAMWTDVCPRGIQEGLRLLKEGGTPARLLVIDDGWQQTDVDPQFRADAGEGRRQHSKEELEVDYNLSRLVTGEEGQITQPLQEKLEEQAAQEEAVAARDWTEAAAPTAQPAQERFGAGAVRRALRMLHAGLQRCEMAAIRVVRDTVEAAPSSSPLLRLFAALMAGPLRQPLLRFYAQASCHSRRLLSVKANAKFDSIDAGPEAPLESQASRFGEVVRELKRLHGLDYVYCWQALAGYWSGVMPGAPGTAKYQSSIQYPRPSEGTLEVDASFMWVQPVLSGIALPEDPRPFHKDLHTYMKESGVDGVKVDVQSTIAMFGHSGRGGYAAMGGRWQRSKEESVGRHFGGQCINSMCCSIEDLYNMSSSSISRVSEDFYPKIKASHWAHIANAAYVTLMVGVISVADWDMFHSAHDAAHLHAYARAVSGGMIYVSDKAGDNDFALLERLVLPDGTTLRCRQPGCPTLDCLFADVSRDRRTVLKIWNLNRCCGVVGVFNVQGATWRTAIRNYEVHDPAPPPLTAAVGPGDVPGLPAAEEYAVYCDSTQELRVLGANERWQVEVAGGGGHDLLTLAPIERCGGVGVAAVGLGNMLNCGGAVREFWLEETDATNAPANGRSSAAATLALHGCGTLLLWVSRAPRHATVDGQPAEVQYNEASCAAELQVPQGGSMDKAVVVHF